MLIEDQKLALKGGSVIDIIDSHMHFFSLSQTAMPINQESAISRLMYEFARLNIKGAIVMGRSRGAEGNPTGAGLFGFENTIDPFCYNYPQNIGFCMGINPEGLILSTSDVAIAGFRQIATTPNALGFKLYPGYNRTPVNDPIYYPVFELAEELGLPVAIHTGDTSTPDSNLQLSHPFIVDDIAALFPRVRFVMCHFGNPWFVDAAAVCKNNPNVFTDLSGLVAGRLVAGDFIDRYRGYIDYLKMWLSYLDTYEKVMFGSDWPLVDIDAYIELMATIIPARNHDRFFYGTAIEVYHKLYPLCCNVQ